MKLSSTITIDGQVYGPITDTQQSGESLEDFSVRHTLHVLRWARTNYPEGTIEGWKTDLLP